MPRLANPGTANFNTGANWDSGTVPTGTAFFGASDTAALSLSGGAAVGGWTFNAGASACNFTNLQPSRVQRRRHRCHWRQCRHHQPQQHGVPQRGLSASGATIINNGSPVPGREYGWQRQYHQQ